MIEGLEEESKSTDAKRCARIYAECNKKPGKIIITFISMAQIQQFSFQMRFNTILEEIKSTLAKSLFLQSLFTNQIKSNQMLVFERGKPEYPGENLS